MVLARSERRLGSSSRASLQQAKRVGKAQLCTITHVLHDHDVPSELIRTIINIRMPCVPGASKILTANS